MILLRVMAVCFLTCMMLASTEVQAQDTQVYSFSESKESILTPEDLLENRETEMPATMRRGNRLHFVFLLHPLR